MGSHNQLRGCYTNNSYQLPTGQICRSDNYQQPEWTRTAAEYLSCVCLWQGTLPPIIESMNTGWLGFQNIVGTFSRIYYNAFGTCLRQSFAVLIAPRHEYDMMKIWVPSCPWTPKQRYIYNSTKDYNVFSWQHVWSFQSFHNHKPTRFRVFPRANPLLAGSYCTPTESNTDTQNKAAFTEIATIIDTADLGQDTGWVEFMTIYKPHLQDRRNDGENSLWAQPVSARYAAPQWTL